MGACSSTVRPDAILWDLDGTLIDTSRQSISALQASVQVLTGQKVNKTEFLLPIITTQKDGASAQDIQNVKKNDKLGWAEQVLKEIDDSKSSKSKRKVTPEMLVSEWEIQMLRNRKNIALMPGALEAVRHFADKNIPQAICTMSNAQSVALKRAKHDQLFSKMKLVLTSDDPHVKKRKPAPDIFLVAAERLGVKPTNCIVIEDSPEGCRAGWSAGAKVVAVAGKVAEIATVVLFSKFAVISLAHQFSFSDAWSGDKIGKGIQVFASFSSLLEVDFKKLGC